MIGMSQRRDLLCLTALIAVFLLITVHFRFWVSAYGDAPSYAKWTFALLEHDGFLSLGSQPLFPLAVAVVKAAFGSLQPLFFIQQIMYLATIMLAFFAFRSLLGFWGSLALSIFVVIDIREYFYMTTSLTEIFNFFLFVTFLAGMESAPKFGTFAFMLLNFVRASNFGFGALLTGTLLPQHSMRRLGILAFAALLPRLMYQMALQKHPNNTGMYLHSVIVGSCGIEAPYRCPSTIYDDPSTPKLQDFWRQNGKFSFSEGAVFSSPFDPEYGLEMRLAFMRLLRQAPGAYLHKAFFSIPNEISGSYFPPYPEDPNLPALQLWPIHLLAIVSNMTSSVAAGMALVLGLPIFFLAWRQANATICAAVLWVFVNVFASNFLLEEAYISDATRERMHYEFAALLIVIFSIRWAMQRVRDGASGQAPATSHQSAV